MLGLLIICVKVKIPRVIFSESELNHTFFFFIEFNQIHVLVRMLGNRKLAEELHKFKLAFSVDGNLSPFFTNELEKTSFIFLGLQNQSGGLFIQNGLTNFSKW